MTKKEWIQVGHIYKIWNFSLGFIFCFLCMSCSSNDEQELNTLSDFLDLYETSQLDEVIACAASAKNDSTTSYIYYYPIPEARNIQYFETSSIQVDPNDFSQYDLKSLPTENVFGGYLERFVRNGNDEVYCIVTFETDGKFHRSNPIRLKNTTKPTEYTNNLDVDDSQFLMPRFSWQDGMIAENAIYFQVISDENQEFISGTYTFDLWFQYYKLSNVVLDINREIPEDLIIGNQYNFTMLAVSLDNWVNLVIDKPFTAQ